MKKITLGFIVCIVVSILGVLVLARKVHAPANIYIILHDGEPDDRIALMVAAARIPHHEILLVGTSFKNAALKKALTIKLFEQLKISAPVDQGSGSAPGDYYQQEGVGILPEEKLESLRHAAYSSTDFQEHLERILRNNRDVECIILTAPTDLVAVLIKNPSLRKHIKRVHIMGGWYETLEEGVLVRRTTFNWNIAPEASAQLMMMRDIPMTLYSSHMIKKFFKGGSCNIDTCQPIIERMQMLRATVPSLRDQYIAAIYWDEQILAKSPSKAHLAPYKGNQFTPADPLVVVGVVNPKLITATQAVDITIDLGDSDPTRGSRVTVTPNPQSNVQLVEEIDIDIFEKELIQSLNQIATASFST